MSASSPVVAAQRRDLAMVSPLMQGLLEHSDQADHRDHEAEAGSREEGVVRGRTGAVPQFILI